jgi:hypothetical protein
VTPISRLGMPSLFMTGAVVAAAALMQEGRPALAQGNIVCAYGTARYKSCCNESYRQRPNLGARARANDIDACMNGRSQNPPAAKNPPAETTPSESAGPDTGETGARIRRIDCDSGGCATGCDTDELAISAFCAVGFYPTLLAERSVRCSNGTRMEAPTSLFCAKK